MRGNKNDFSMTFYDGEEKRLFLEFVQTKLLNGLNLKI